MIGTLRKGIVMARHALLACCVCVLVISGMVFADIVPLPSFKNPEAKKAKSKYDEAVSNAKKEYEQRLTQARETLIADLDLAQKGASDAGDLDEAVRIRDVKKLAENTDDRIVLREGALRFQGAQYRIFLADVTWLQARQACQRLGGDLAVLDTREKRDFLKDHVSNVQLWVGASYNPMAQRWFWVNNKVVAAELWSPGRPANFGPYAELFGNTMLLGDAGKGKPPDCKGYICEWIK